MEAQGKEVGSSLWWAAGTQEAQEPWRLRDPSSAPHVLSGSPLKPLLTVVWQLWPRTWGKLSPSPKAVDTRKSPPGRSQDALTQSHIQSPGAGGREGQPQINPGSTPRSSLTWKCRASPCLLWASVSPPVSRCLHSAYPSRLSLTAVADAPARPSSKRIQLISLREGLGWEGLLVLLCTQGGEHRLSAGQGGDSSLWAALQHRAELGGALSK